MSSSNLILWVIIIVVIAVASFLLEAWFDSQKRRRVYQYLKRNCIMTEAEHKCFNLLGQSIGETYYVFPQIHLPSILDNRVYGQNWFGAFRHIDEKSVDFVLCSKDTLCPVLVIELDDRSHERPDRQDRDREVERILKEAGLPLLRLANHSHFDINELAKKIGDTVQISASQVTEGIGNLVRK